MTARRAWSLVGVTPAPGHSGNGFGLCGHDWKAGGVSLLGSGTLGATSTDPAFSLPQAIDGGTGSLHGWYSGNTGFTGIRIWYDFGAGTPADPDHVEFCSLFSFPWSVGTEVAIEWTDDDPASSPTWHRVALLSGYSPSDNTILSFPVPTSVHRAWKLQYDSSPRGFGSCATLEMRGVLGGPDLTQGATGGPFGSNYYSGSYDFAKAFDNDPATFWSSSGSSGTEFIGWDFGAGNGQSIAQLSFLPRPDSFAGPDAPATGGLEWTNDDPAVSPTWTRLFSFGPTSGWAVGVPQLFSAPAPDPPGVYSSRMSEYLLEGPPTAIYDSRMSQYVVEGSNKSLFVSRSSQYLVLGPIRRRSGMLIA